MNRNVIETLIGAVVLLIAAGFLFTAYKSGNVQQATGYTVNAKFDRVDGLNLGSDVRISGIKVGAVTGAIIDPETYQAVVTLTVKDDIKLPKDSSAEIIGDGLLGSKYVAVIPGGDTEMMAQGEEIKYTQSSISLEALIGKFIYGGADGKDKKAAAASEERVMPEPKAEGSEGNANLPPSL